MKQDLAFVICAELGASGRFRLAELSTGRLGFLVFVSTGSSMEGYELVEGPTTQP